MATTNGTSGAPPMGSIHKGIVKMVLSADTIVIRGQPVGGPPPEKTICIAGIQAPKLQRRPATIAPGVLGKDNPPDEPFAWEAREFLRKKLVGKEVTFVLAYKTTTNDREFGSVHLGSSTTGENMAESLISEGLVQVREGGRGDDNSRLKELEATAQAAKKGRWAADADGTLSDHVRSVDWSPEISKNFVDQFHGQPVKAVIEQVRDGSTVRAFLLPGYQYVTVMMSGIKCPVIRLGEAGKVLEAEQYAEEAKFFSEVRLLQRDVEVILQSTSNQAVVGTVQHPAGSIAELLLREGYARCVDWSISLSDEGPERLRNAEKAAKEKRLRIWKDFTPAKVADRKAYQAKVMEVVNGDALMIRKDNGQVEKIFLSSIRSPKREELGGEMGNGTGGRNFRPLYDVPFMFEAREFLRKRLIHKRVSIVLDYEQEPNDQFPGRKCCTVTFNGQNMAEALVSKGLATVIRYRQGDDDRSAAYDALLAAQTKAEKSEKGLWSLKGSNRPDKLPIVRVQDLQGDSNKAKQFLPYLTRAGRCEGIVEFVASGSRLRVYIPKETCLVTILLSGISCPRADRLGGAGGPSRGDEYGNDALAFTKERVLQREVELEVEGADKAGSFIGWVRVLNEGGTTGPNLAEELVRAGLATVHSSADFTNYAHILRNAEEEAKKRGDKLWTGYQEIEKAAAAEAAAAETADRRLNYRTVCITGLNPGNKIAVQFEDEGPKLEKLMEDLRRDLTENPPVTGAYNPRRGDLCAARFSADKLWYRAKVEDVKPTHVLVLFVDFGNREKTQATELALLPPQFSSLAPGAKEFGLACLAYPEDQDYVEDGAAWIRAELGSAMRRPGVTLRLNQEYRLGTSEFATFVFEEEAEKKAAVAAAEGGESSTSSAPPEKPTPKRTDLGRLMLEAGLALVELRKERRLQPLVTEYLKAQEKAKKNHCAIWQYGDFTGTDI